MVFGLQYALTGFSSVIMLTASCTIMDSISTATIRSRFRVLHFKLWPNSIVALLDLLIYHADYLPCNLISYKVMLLSDVSFSEIYLIMVEGNLMLNSLLMIYIIIFYYLISLKAFIFGVLQNSIAFLCMGQTQLLNCCHGNAHGNLNIRGISNHCQIDYDWTKQFEFGVIALKK